VADPPSRNILNAEVRQGAGGDEEVVPVVTVFC